MNGVVKGKDAEDREIVKELVVAKSHQNQAFIYGKKLSACTSHILHFSLSGLGVKGLISCHLLISQGKHPPGLGVQLGVGFWVTPDKFPG